MRIIISVPEIISVMNHFSDLHETINENNDRIESLRQENAIYKIQNQELSKQIEGINERKK